MRMDSNAILSGRLDKARRLLAEHHLDALLLASYQADAPQGVDYGFYYLTNLYSRYMGFVIVTEKDCAAWVTASELERAKEDSWVPRLEPMELPAEHPFLTTAEEFAGMALKRVQELCGRERPYVGVSGRNLPAAVGIPLAQAGATVVDVSSALEKARMVKDALEIDLLRRGCQLADLGVQATMDALRAGVTERQLTARAEFAMKYAGADCFWWKTLMSSGPQAERWMTAPSDRVIQAGDLVVTDFTPVYRGYAGDIARSFVCGKASADQREVFDLAQRTLQAAADAVTEGVTAGELMRAGAAVVRGSRFEPYYAGDGHGIGLYDDTYPIFLASTEQIEAMPATLRDERFMANSVVALEIIFTVPGLGGVRLEDNYLVTSGRPERLTHAPMVVEV